MLGGNQQTVIEAWIAIIENLKQLRLKYPNLDGLKYWNTIKPLLDDIDTRNNISIKYNPGHMEIVREFEQYLSQIPEKDSNEKLIEKNHFLLQQLNLPYKDKGKVSFRRFMQIALNIGQFHVFNNTSNFSSEIIELIKKNNLSDINTYMTPNNYNKFIFNDADLLKLKNILTKLNKNPPIKQLGGRKYPIHYLF